MQNKSEALDKRDFQNLVKNQTENNLKVMLSNNRREGVSDASLKFENIDKELWTGTINTVYYLLNQTILQKSWRIKNFF